MEKYRKLLESTIAEDIALGLFLCHKDNLLEEGFFKIKVGLGITIQFDEWSIWNSNYGQTLHIQKAPFNAGPGIAGRWGGNDFDFRTKTEE